MTPAVALVDPHAADTSSSMRRAVTVSSSRSPRGLSSPFDRFGCIRTIIDVRTRKGGVLRIACGHQSNNRKVLIGTEHDLLDVVAMGLPKHHRRPAAAPPLRPRHFLASTAYSKDESPARPSRLCDRRSRLTTLSRHLVPMALRSPQQSCA